MKKTINVCVFMLTTHHFYTDNFCTQALHHRHQRCSTRHHVGSGGRESGGVDHEVTEGEVSRTPEDSVCSIEGPSAIYNDGPSTYSEVGYGTPNVSYRVSHKQ